MSEHVNDTSTIPLKELVKIPRAEEKRETPLGDLKVAEQKADTHLTEQKLHTLSPRGTDAPSEVQELTLASR